VVRARDGADVAVGCEEVVGVALGHGEIVGGADRVGSADGSAGWG